MNLGSIMHARHRTPGEGLRGNSFGLGQPSVRGSAEPGLRHLSHPSEYKGSSGRGAGRGASKPHLLGRKNEIMMEAGRLAAEYLVSQGLLPPNSLVHKGQNGSLARLSKEGPEVRVCEKEFMANENGRSNYVITPMEVDGSSLLTGRDEEVRRQGLGTSEMVVGGKRKLLDDSFDGKNQFKDRKHGNFKGIGRDWNQGEGRSGPVLNKCVEICPSKPNVDDLARYQGEKMATLEFGGVPKATDSITCKSGVEGDSDSDLENFEFPDTTDSKPFCSSISKAKESFGAEDSFERKIEKSEPQNSATISKEARSLDVGELRDSLYWNERETQNPLQQRFAKTDVVTKDSRGSSPTDTSRRHVSIEEDLRSMLIDRSNSGVSPTSIDLVQLCSHGQVPTKARSLTRHKATDAEHCFDRRLLTAHGGRNTGEFLSGKGSNNSREDDLVEESGKSCWNLRGSCSESTRVRAHRPAEEVGELDPSIVAEKDRFAKSYSFSDRSSFMHQQESGRWPPGFGGIHGGDSVSQNGRMLAYGRSRSMFQHRDMDSPMSRGNRWEGAKRQREWPPGRISQADEFFRLHNLKARKTSAQLKGPPAVSEEVFESAEQVELDEKTPVKKDLNVIVTSKAVISDSGSNDEQGSLSTGSKVVDPKLNLNIATTAEIEDPDAFMSEKQRASAQISSLLAKIHKGNSNESSMPVLEEELTTDCTQKDEGKVLVAECRPNKAENEEGTVYAFFQDLLKDCPLLRHLYHSHDGSKDYECLVCLSSSSVSERKFSSLVGLLRHAKDDKEMPLMHKGYGHAICELLDLDNSRGTIKDVESAEQQSKQALQTEEGVRDAAEPATLSPIQLESNVAVD